MNEIVNIDQIKLFLTNEKLEDIKIYNNNEWLKIIICTAKSKRHIFSMIQKLKLLKLIKKEDINGSAENEWMICPIADYDIHFFLKEKRNYYDIDELWRQYESQ